MRVLVVSSVVVAFVLAAPAAASAHYPISGKDCKPIKFRPGTDDSAFDIEAKRVGCKKVRRVIKKIRFTERTSGFRCKSRVRSSERRNPYAHQDNKCRKGRQVFVYVRT